MATIIDVDHETGDLSEYSSTTTDGGDLSVSAGAALHGSYGLSCVIDDTTAIKGDINTAQSASLQFRFYIDPNGLTMANNTYFRAFRWLMIGGPWAVITYISLKYLSSAYQLLIEAQNDAGATVLSDYAVISDAPHCVEFRCTSATTSSSNDGSYEWWVDGSSQGSATSVDNYNYTQDYEWSFSVGAIDEIDAGTSGTFYIDSILANDTGAYIGEVAGQPMSLRGINVPGLRQWIKRNPGF